MATKDTLRLRAIQPRDRVYKAVGPSKRRSPEKGKHTRKALMPDGSFVIVHMTKRRPWTRRAQQRLRNRIAAASRKANR